MPARIVREGILTSEAVNQLSDTAELFYRRLMSVVDDYGRFFANPTILRSFCFPTRPGAYSDDEVEAMLSECESTATHPLIIRYANASHLLITNFRQQTRSKSKFPEPAADELLSKWPALAKQDAKQMLSLVGVVFVVGDGEREREKGPPPEGSVERDPGTGRVTKWDEAVRVLMATGKFEPGTLTAESVAEIDRTFPKVDLTDQATLERLALEAAGVTGKIGSVMPWLRKAVSRLDPQRGGQGSEKKNAATSRKFDDGSYVDPRTRHLAVGRE